MNAARVAGLGLVVAAVCTAKPDHAASADGENSNKTVRPPQFAASWYPGDAGALAKEVDDLLARASAPAFSCKPTAIISPHAGYRFSAATAAAGYRYLKGHEYSRVIVLAFSHRGTGRYAGVDVPESITAYATPLGEVPVDRAVCDQLLRHPLFTSHPGVDRGEHSLELQLPFLQRALGHFTLVPLYVGRVTDSICAAAANALLPVLDEKTLLVASSDFTHFGPRYNYTPFSDDVANRIRTLADEAAAVIERCDYDGFREHLRRTGDTICGRSPVSLLLRVLSMRGRQQGVRAGFDTSGRITDDWTNSVTYQSFVFSSRPGTLADRDRAQLLQLARGTVTAYVTGEAVPAVVSDNLSEALRADGACFVTLENHGRLRGCIGNMLADRPLYNAVIQNAVSACRDQRFRNDPVTTPELDQLNIEISYLTPLQRVENSKDIVVGRHGLLIAVGQHRGVLLPQVAARRAWTRDEFLAHTCRKAGLPPEAWKEPTAEIYSFEAEVFGETEPRSPGN
ncbi:MAG: AmmeMemoRadiSam system protein B [Phycisphaerae bacterium]